MLCYYSVNEYLQNYDDIYGDYTWHYPPYVKIVRCLLHLKKGHRQTRHCLT
jgi:hypothetical protein